MTSVGKKLKEHDKPAAPSAVSSYKSDKKYEKAVGDGLLWSSQAKSL